MKKAIIFLNGDAPSKKATDSIDYSDAFVICADGAYSSYARNIARVDLIVGDFDSMDKNADLGGVTCERHSVRKDMTDSQLAVMRAVEKGLFDIEIYGAFGRRGDHEFVNYSLLALANKHGARAVLKGGAFDVFYVTPSDPFVAVVEKGKIVSLVPYGEKAHILSTKGLSYEAHDVTVEKWNIFTTSNCSCGGEIEYRLQGGDALLFVENRAEVSL